MFKYVVFVTLLVLAVASPAPEPKAAPKPSLLAYSAPLVTSPVAYSAAYSAPVAYTSYAFPAVYAGSYPDAYSAYSPYSAPLVVV